MGNLVANDFKKSGLKYLNSTSEEPELRYDCSENSNQQISELRHPVYLFLCNEIVLPNPETLELSPGRYRTEIKIYSRNRCLVQWEYPE